MLSSAYNILRIDCNNLKPHILIFILTYIKKLHSNIDVNKLSYLQVCPCIHIMLQPTFFMQVKL